MECPVPLAPNEGAAQPSASSTGLPRPAPTWWQSVQERRTEAPTASSSSIPLTHTQGPAGYHVVWGVGEDSDDSRTSLPSGVLYLEDSVSLSDSSSWCKASSPREQASNPRDQQETLDSDFDRKAGDDDEDVESQQNPRDWPDLDKWLSRVPLDEDGNQTSIGSIGHYDGTCKRPCSFAHTTKKCINGALCNFCHFFHKGERVKKSQPCKAQRERYRMHQEHLKNDLERAPHEFDVDNVELPECIARNETVKEKTLKMLREFKESLMSSGATPAERSSSSQYQ